MEKLELYGFIKRESCGAFLIDEMAGLKSFSLLNLDNLDKKKINGRKTVKIIESGNSIILDSGSTTTEIAKNLVGRSGLMVIPGALSLIDYIITDPFTDSNYLQLLENQNIELIIAEETI